MSDIGSIPSPSLVRAASSMVAARAYHDTHQRAPEARPAPANGLGPHRDISATTPEDVKARVAEVIAATRAIVLGSRS